MTSVNPKKLIKFGPYEITDQVFYTTLLSYCLVNIKPILPGHVLVIPFRCVPRFTDLHAEEVTDLFVTVQKTQKMLAQRYFAAASSSSSSNNDTGEANHGNENIIMEGSFNVALQDGPDSGQTVPHVHVHIIPRIKGNEEGDGIYAKLQGEEGNVGGGYWDSRRPVQRGMFPKVADEDRKPRETEEMNREAEELRRLMEEVE